MIKNNKEKSNKKSIIWTLISIGIVIGGVFLFFIILQVSLNTTIPLTVVSGKSMEPTYYEGDLLILQGVPTEDIVVGDHEARNGSVIVFYSRYTQNLVVHRVIDKRFNNITNNWEFRTQGDNNPTADHLWEPESSVYGVVILRIPWIGWAALIFTQYPVVGYSIIGVLIVILILSSFEQEKEKAPSGNKEKDSIKNEDVNYAN